MKDKEIKTYYDLTSEEIKKYRSEFVKTSSVGRALYFVTNLIQFGMLMLLICLIGILLLDDTKNLSLIGWIIFIGVFGCVPQMYLNINFSCWLKHKYGIKRW